MTLTRCGLYLVKVDTLASDGLCTLQGSFESSSQDSSQECVSINSSLAQWARGKLDVGEVWTWVEMDITHYDDRHYLTLIDCGCT